MSTRKSSPANTKVNVDEVGPKNRITLKRDEVMEYRALMAEHKVAVSECSRISEKVQTEKSKPQYKALLELMHEEQKYKEEVRYRAALLLEIQRQISEKLGVSYNEFCKEFVVDLETGVVRKNSAEELF